MEEVPCCHCGVFFKRSPRHKGQNYCMQPECRKARKAAWKREKMRLEEQFRLNHNRKRDSARKQGTSPPGGLIAKVDASKPYKFKPIGQYYLLPVIAKVDALKVRIYEVTAPYP